MMAANGVKVGESRQGKSCNSYKKVVYNQYLQ